MIPHHSCFIHTLQFNPLNVFLWRNILVLSGCEQPLQILVDAVCLNSAALSRFQNDFAQHRYFSSQVFPCTCISTCMFFSCTALSSTISLPDLKRSPTAVSLQERAAVLLAWVCLRVCPRVCVSPCPSSTQPSDWPEVKSHQWSRRGRVALHQQQEARFN